MNRPDTADAIEEQSLKESSFSACISLFLWNVNSEGKDTFLREKQQQKHNSTGQPQKTL